MKLSSPFFKLPLCFDAGRMLQEVERFAAHEWRPDRFGIDDYHSLNLVSFQGKVSDIQQGPLLPTRYLEESEYLRQVIASFDSVVAEARLRWLGGHAQVPIHYDADYAWHRRFRVHVPITTDPGVGFRCDGVQVNMKAGELWLFNNEAPHEVVHAYPSDRVHLIVDLTPSPAFWALVDRAQRVPGPSAQGVDAPPCVSHRPGERPPIATETLKREAVLDAAELTAYVGELMEYWRAWPGLPAAVVAGVEAELTRFAREWTVLWVQHGPARVAWPAYRRLAEALYQRCFDLAGKMGTELYTPIRRVGKFLTSAAFNPYLGAFDRPIAADRLLSTPLQLSGDVLFRVTPGGDLALASAGSLSFRRCEPEELLLLHAIGMERTASDASVRAGLYLAEEELTPLVRRLVDEGILMPGAPEPALALSLPEAVLPAVPSAPPAPASLPPLPPRARLCAEVIFRVFQHGGLGMFVPKLRQYREVTPDLALFINHLAQASSMQEAAENAGVTYGAAVEKLGAKLVDFELLGAG